jgi:phage N-6-adenine-methyltransferase
MGVHFSSQTDEWSTPQWLFEALDQEFGFTLDACSTHENAKCGKHYTRTEDGLRQSWENEIVWMNPPYGRAIETWISRAHDAAEREQATVVCLIPARTDTRWWHRYVMKHEIRLLRGRLRFGDAMASAPFPSAVVVMRPKAFRLLSVEA